jgi:phosphopantothenoylcysteine decarboxylase/phosphopantothenate--cysteine ligase
MGHLNQRNIIIGVCGGIAAYKSAELVRLLQKQGANVRVVMTDGAQAFITPLTLQALSGNTVHTELLDAEAERGMGHIELARWADAIVVAPATADVLAKLANGDADNLLTTLVLATAAPIVVAPAMNQQMWAQAATQDNCDTLRQRNVIFVGPEAGEQACGDIGAGRMSEPSDIVDALNAHFPSRALDGLHVVITAGPTREAIDPVRFIGNHSSGKMGFALARAATEAGASVTLISGPVHLPTPEGVKRLDVESTQQMLDACQAACSLAHIFIGCAAVADYRPVTVAEHKIKKQSDQGLTIELTQNPDIVATISRDFPNLYTAGFAAETQNVLDHARQKRHRKQLNLIIANDVSNGGVFGQDHNSVTIIGSELELHLPLANKLQVARSCIEALAEDYRRTHSRRSRHE